MEFWENIEPGTQIPEIVKHPDYKQVFMYSAITWNRHLIHYNSNQAIEEGHEDVVVQRALLGSYLAQMISDWIKENGMLRRLEWKVIQSAFPGDVLTCKGEVINKTITADEMQLACNVCIENEQKNVVVTGLAVIATQGKLLFPS
jgi:hydroxyacyl-ACP dehydratase HTD2-like protein with hotdog domain